MLRVARRHRGSPDPRSPGPTTSRRLGQGVRTVRHHQRAAAVALTRVRRPLPRRPLCCVEFQQVASAHSWSATIGAVAFNSSLLVGPPNEIVPQPMMVAVVPAAHFAASSVRMRRSAYTARVGRAHQREIVSIRRQGVVARMPSTWQRPVEVRDRFLATWPAPPCRRPAAQDLAEVGHAVGGGQARCSR